MKFITKLFPCQDIFYQIKLIFYLTRNTLKLILGELLIKLNLGNKQDMKAKVESTELWIVVIWSIWWTFGIAASKGGWSTFFCVVFPPYAWVTSSHWIMDYLTKLIN